MSATLSLIAPDDEFVKWPCGGFTWRIYWVLNGVTPNTKGAVVQKIDVSVKRTTCSGLDTSWSLIFWEAFEVTGGKFAPLHGMEMVPDGGKFGGPIMKPITYPGGSDNFKQPSNPESHGSIRVLALAKFIADWKCPPDMTPRKLMRAGSPARRLTPAGILPATQNQPPGWDDDDVEIRRSVRVRWNCCEKKSASYAYGWGEPSD